jgi:hypothetical protein
MQGRFRFFSTAFSSNYIYLLTMFHADILKGKTELWFFSFTLLQNKIYLPTKFHGHISYSFRYVVPDNSQSVK